MLCRSLLIFLPFAVCVLGHGRVLSPAGRSTAWRLGFNTTVNFNDAGNFCGGFYRHYYRNHGKCGICGDSYDQRTPRDNEMGGKYGTGVIVATYKPGAVFTAIVQLTAFHKGYWEFKLCPDVERKDQDCFDQYVLELQNGQGTKFFPTEGEALYHVDYRLPIGLICHHCVLQWRYIAGNNFGSCKNGTGALGCGNQEQFLACSDIKIDKSALTHLANETTINYKTLDFMPSRIKQVFATEKYPLMPDVEDEEDYVNDIKVNSLSESKEEIVSPLNQFDNKILMNGLNNEDDKTTDFLSDSEEYESLEDDNNPNIAYDDSEDVFDVVEDTKEKYDNKAKSSFEVLENEPITIAIAENQGANNEYLVDKSCDSTQQCYKDIIASEKHSYDQSTFVNQNIATANEVSPDFLKSVPYVCMPYVKWALSQNR